MRKICFIALFVFFTSGMFAQGFFGPENVITEGLQSGPDIVQAGDIDGDGNSDLLVTTHYSYELAWFRNNGFGSFGNAEVIMDDGRSGTEFQLFDLDTDNDLDIVYLDDIQNRLGWLENDGNGSFGPLQLISQGTNLYNGFSIADINGDDQFDIVFDNVGDLDDLNWFQNNGDGTFTFFEIAFEQFEWINRSGIGDITGDGTIELILTHQVDTVFHTIWYDFDLAGNIGEAQATPLLELTSRFPDLDGDGDLDILITNDTLLWYRNDGSGTFTGQELEINSGDAGGISHFVDMDDDGDRDIIYKIDVNRIIKWWENTGDESYIDGGLISSTSFHWDVVLPVDLNNDGLTDIVTTKWERDLIYMYLNNDLSGFDTGSSIGELSEINAPEKIFADDLGNDGDNDLLITSQGGGTLNWYENESMSFQQLPGLTTSDYSSFSYQDWENDGDYDILGLRSRILGVSRNDGNGNFGVWEEIVSLEDIFGSPRVHLSDFDNDGDIDLIITSSGVTNVYVSENTGGVYAIPVLVSGNGNILLSTITSSIIDYNNDDFEDVLCLQSAGGIFNYTREIFILRNNNGSGTYTKVMIEDDYESAINMKAADLNEDGDVDIVVSTNSDGIEWLENTGASSFFAKQPISSQVTSTTNHYFDDLNDDGHIDIAARGVNSLFWYAGDGAGNFSAENYISENITITNLDLSDLDDDGDIDLAFVYANSDKIGWFENLLSDSLGIVNGKVYWDRNNSTSYEETDSEVAGLPVTLLPEGQVFYTNALGDFTVYVSEPGAHTIAIDTPMLIDCEGPVDFDVDPAGGEFDFNYANDGATLEQDFRLIAETPCEVISGIVFDDENENGVQDPGEGGVAGVLVEAEGELITFSSANGRYFFELDGREDHTISLDLPPSETNGYCTANAVLYEQTYPLAPATYFLEANNFSSADTLDFGVSAENAGSFDVSLISLMVMNGNRAGKAFHAYMDFKSSGAITETCTLRITHDPLITFLNSDIPPMTIGNTFVEWIFPPGTTPPWHCMQMNWYLDGDAVQGDTLHWEATYQCPPIQDICPYNNTLIRDVPIISGPLREAAGFADLYSLRPEGTMPQVLSEDDQTLSYVISFQNPLPTTVYNVTIIDTLPDDALDMATVSRPFGNFRGDFCIDDGNVLIWEIDGIELADASVDELNSYGFVQFNVTLKPNLPEGTVFTNRATVWFNGVEPTSTNEVLHELAVNTSSGPHHELPILELYPNPMTRFTNIRLSGSGQAGYSLEIVSSTGQLVRFYPSIGNTEIRIDRDDLPAGFYVINLYSDSGMRLATRKLSIQ